MQQFHNSQQVTQLPAKFRRFGSLVVRTVDLRLDGREFHSRPPQLALGWVTVSQAGKPPQYFTKPPRPTQPPTLSRMENEHRPKCGDVLWLGSKGSHDSHHCVINH